MTKKQLPEGLKAKGRRMYLAISTLEIDPATQRSLNRPWIKAHVPIFDPEFFGEIVVSIRDGRHLIVDGQHRVELLRAMGWAGDQKVPCLVYEGLTLAQEAALFLGLGDDRKPRTFDLFRISIVAGDETACDIERIVRAQGLSLSEAKKDGAISAVRALQKVYDGAGLAQASPIALAKTLKILRGAWGKDGTAFEAPLILGVGLFVIRHDGKFDEPSLVAKLSKSKGGPSGMTGRAKGVMEAKHRPLAHCVAAGIVDAYDSGRRSGKLGDWRQ